MILFGDGGTVSVLLERQSYLVRVNRHLLVARLRSWRRWALAYVLLNHNQLLGTGGRMKVPAMDYGPGPVLTCSALFLIRYYVHTANVALDIALEKKSR